MINLTQSNNLLVCEHLLDQVAREGLFTDGLLSQSQPELTGLQSHVLIWVLGPLQHVLVRNNKRWWERGKKPKPRVECLKWWFRSSHTRTWMMLCMCGMRRSMRTSNSMTRALHTFFRTSLSSSPASANRLWIGKETRWEGRQVAKKRDRQAGSKTTEGDKIEVAKG